MKIINDRYHGVNDVYSKHRDRDMDYNKQFYKTTHRRQNYCNAVYKMHSMTVTDSAAKTHAEKRMRLKTIV